MDYYFEAIANKHRRKILLLLTTKHTVSDLVGKLPLSQPTVSSHLSVLKKAGLVDFEVKQRERIYFLRQKGISDLKFALDELMSQVLDIRVRMR